MTTAELIAAINDRGKFEILATAVLRSADADCAGLIHAGVNDAGETIVAPLDGFRVITHTAPPKVISVAHTTADRKKLKGKLLTANDSDLKNAEDHISTCRKRMPGAAAKIVLCINEPMGRESQLYLDITEKAAELAAELEIWDRVRIANFLDHDPDGQWIRQYHFGVSAQRPSAALLRVLGRRSIQALRDEVIPAGTIIVDRSIDRALEPMPVPAVTWLVGPSGSGKSTAALRHAERVLGAEGFAFYLPAEALRPGYGLAEVLEHHLRALHPEFAPGVGDASLSLATEFQPLRLIIEDINRPEAGDKLGDRLTAWAARPSMADTGKEVTALPVHLVVPVWPELWSTNAHAWGNPPRARVIEVGPLTADEGVTVVRTLAHERGFEISNIDAEDVASAAAGDPFLIGLLSEMSTEVMSAPDLLRVARLDVIGEYLRRLAKKLAPRNGRPLDDYSDALNALADSSLRGRVLRPTTQQVRDWLNQRDWSAISELLDDGALCRRTTDKVGREVLAMRHDRFQSEVLARRAGQLLKHVDENTDVLADPFYATIVGRAVATGVADVNDFGKIVELSPVAMFEALRFVGEPHNAYQNAIVATCQAWAENSGPEAVDAVNWAISRILSTTDSRATDRAARSLPQNRDLLLARFRNGDVEAAVHYVPLGFELYPATRDRRFENTVDHVRMHHQSSVSKQVLELISNAQSTPVACGTITLAGYFQVSDILSLVPDLMTRSTLDPRELLPHLLWVGLRCVPEVLAKGPALLDRLMDLPTGEPEGFNNDQSRVCQDLGWAGRHGYMHESITTTIEWAGVVKERRMIAATILETVDDADAAEFVASVWAEVDYWGGLRESPTTLSTSELKRHEWSSPYMTRLQQIWSNRGIAEKLRCEAFSMWLRGASHQHFPAVVAANEDPVLSRQVLQWRVKSGDQRVAPLLVKAAHEQPFWWRFAHHIWNPVLRVAIQEMIAAPNVAPNNLWVIGDLLYDIPVADAEAILLQNQLLVRTSEPLICAAAVVGTPRLQKLVADSLSSWTGEKSPLRFIGMKLDKLRFKGGGRPKRFKSLEPFLDKLDQETLESIGRAAEASGAGEWAVTNVWSRATRSNGPPGDAGFVAELGAQYSDARRWPSDVKYSCDRFIATGSTSRKILDLTFVWVQNHLDERGIAIASEVVAYLGGRGDANHFEQLVRAGAVSTTIDRQLQGMTFRVRRATLANSAEDRATA